MFGTGLAQGLGEEQALDAGLVAGMGLEGRLAFSKSSGSSEVSGLLLMVKTQPSFMWRRTRRPGGRSRALSTLGQQGNIWRSRAQQRYCREVGV